ncbi:MAG TPA: hypothetical protein VJ802_07120 [Gemmatimonadaceae bacterium]|nr:hypothetical protein [Gemmatimonadaceae bacterium]
MTIRPSSSAAAFALASVMVLASCDSPEADRVRGGGERGADVGNRNPIIETHAGSKMYYDTPCLMPDDECSGPPAVSGLPGDFPDTKRRGT